MPKFERHGKERDRGYVSYIKRKDMQADDKLGQNIGFFRQWRLSEIRYADGHLYMKPCAFAKSCLWPQAKEESGNPYAPEIPLWSDTRSGEGLHPLQPLNKLDAHNGGAAVIIWAHGTPEQFYFVDIYAPLETIIKKVLEISEEYSVDPVIAISDAGSFAQKFKTDANNVLHFAPNDKLSPSSPNTGAGFCYIPCRNNP